MNHYRYIVIGLITTTGLLPGQVFARTVIHNDIQNTVNTGGNTASPGVSGNGGTVTTGSQRAEVRLETVVNGETVEDINESITGSEGLDIERRQSIEGGEVTTHIKVTASASTSASTTGTGSTSADGRVETPNRAGVPVKKDRVQNAERRKSIIKNVRVGEKSSASTSSSTPHRKSNESFVKKILNYVQSLFRR